MSIALVSQAVNATTGATSVAVTIATPSVGNLLVATCINNANRVSGITGGGVTWLLAKQSVFGNYAADIWYGIVTGTPGTTVTLTFTGTTYGAAWVGEFSGIRTASQLDATTDTDDATSNTQSTGGFTASASPVLNIAVLALSGGFTISTGPSGGFTAATVSSAGGVMRNYTAYRIDTTAASNAVGWTTSVSQQWSASMAAFLGSTSGSGSAPLVTGTAAANAARPGVSAPAGLASIAGAAYAGSVQQSSAPAGVAIIQAWASQGSYSELDMEPSLLPLDVVAHPAATAAANPPAPSVEVMAGIATMQVKALRRFPAPPGTGSLSFPGGGDIRIPTQDVRVPA